MNLRLLLILVTILPSFTEGAVVLFTPPESVFFYRESESPAGETITPLDVDGNGSVDFQLGAALGHASGVRPERRNKLLVVPATPPDLGGVPFPLQDNTMIGLVESPMGLVFISTDTVDGFVSPDDEGFFLNIISCSAPTGCRGPFYTPVSDEPRRAFLGFEFEIEGEAHYGYFDISSYPGSFGAALNGWAYESEPGKAITTTFVPEPSFLTLAILGFPAILMRRRRQ